MRKAEKIEYLNKPTEAYFSGFGGLEIKEICYDIDDYVIFVAGAWTNKKSVHKVRIYYGLLGGDYFIWKGTRIHLDDCLRS